jgi:CRP-like cAMP-binding protein
MSETQAFETRIFEPGELLLEQDAAGTQAYIVEQGAVRVFLKRGERVVELAELGPGQMIGEMSLLTGDKNAASVRAINKVKASIITRDVLDSRVSNSDPLIRSLLRMLVDRVRDTDEALLKSETREFIEIDFA